jgi:NosR/NirI family nitrous oxide reductase transcriptional regulator
MPTLGPITTYMRWLHTRWPAGTIEKLPVVNDDGSTRIPGLYVVGDLTGIPLLKFSADTGARAVATVLNEPSFQKREKGIEKDGIRALDLVIIGGGVSGMSAALEARRAGLDYRVLEASEPFSTIINFPKAKPIFTYPTDMTPRGELRITAKVKEPLVEELQAQTLAKGVTPVMARAERVVRRGVLLEVVVPGAPSLLAHRVIVAIGRSGNFRKLGVPGEDLDKVSNRLHDPKDFAARNVLVVGGGDSALETAIALATSGAAVTLSYRNKEFSRPKPENIEKIQKLQADPMAEGVAIEHPSSERVTTAAGPFMEEHRKRGSLRLALGSKIKEIRDAQAVITTAEGKEEAIPNDAVFSMIGREAPLEFFRRSGVPIRGEWRPASVLGLVAFFAFCVFLYHWKSDVPAELGIYHYFQQNGWFPFNIGAILGALGGGVAEAASREGNLLYTLRDSASKPSFYYTLTYCLCVVIFGVRRIRRRRTPYVTAQTLTLMAIQCVPLFILPEILLPWMGRNGMFDHGSMKWLADRLFEPYSADGHERAYWRAYGFVLAWPLFVYNAFTEHPMGLWLGIGFVQTFVLIPAIVYRWGKGAYCGWICSCGALAETLGDAQRGKMPHGPIWNRVNMLGQGILASAFALLGLRIAGWMAPGSWADHAHKLLFDSLPFVNYHWLVDTFLAGVVGVGLYFWLSGRVWCRFACPLAALMHIYSRVGTFRILAEKKKCISCNVCTSVCHQGIDVMNFANKGLPMADPECVRCSACVQSCPTGVLTFGRVDRSGTVIGKDRLAASPVQMAESGH